MTPGAQTSRPLTYGHRIATCAGTLMKEVTMSEENEDGGYVGAECFRAYVSAEIKVPNTLIAVGPYVGRAALASLQAGDDLKPAVKRFAKNFAFSRSQMNSAIRTVGLMHGKFGVPVLPTARICKGRPESGFSFSRDLKSCTWKG